MNESFNSPINVCVYASKSTNDHNKIKEFINSPELKGKVTLVIVYSDFYDIVYPINVLKNIAYRMDSIASYEELDLDQEDFCVHIMNNALLDLYVEGKGFFNSNTIDTSKWYCTQCKRPFADKEDMEQHSLANL